MLIWAETYSTAVLAGRVIFFNTNEYTQRLPSEQVLSIRPKQSIELFDQR